MRMSFQARSPLEELKQEEDLLRAREKEVQARREARRLKETRRSLAGGRCPVAQLQEQLEKQQQREQQLTEALREAQPISRINGESKEGQWLLRIAALQEELKQKVHKVHALKAKEQQLEAELRDRLHADAELVPALRLATAELCAVKDTAHSAGQTKPRLSVGSLQEVQQVPQLPERQPASTPESQVQQVQAPLPPALFQVAKLPERQPASQVASLPERQAASTLQSQAAFQVPQLPERQPPMQVPQLPERQTQTERQTQPAAFQVPALPERQPASQVSTTSAVASPAALIPDRCQVQRPSLLETPLTQAARIQTLPLQEQMEVRPAVTVSTSASASSRTSPVPGPRAEVMAAPMAAPMAPFVSPQRDESAGSFPDRSITSIRRLDASLPQPAGAVAEDFCTQCGNRYPLDAIYCRQCGNRRQAKRSSSVVDTNRGGGLLPSSAAAVLTLPVSSRQCFAQVPGTFTPPPSRPSSMRLPAHPVTSVAPIQVPGGSFAAQVQTMPFALPGRRLA